MECLIGSLFNNGSKLPGLGQFVLCILLFCSYLSDTQIWIYDGVLYLANVMNYLQPESFHVSEQPNFADVNSRSHPHSPV